MDRVPRPTEPRHKILEKKKMSTKKPFRQPLSQNIWGHKKNLQEKKKKKRQRKKNDRRNASPKTPAIPKEITKGERDADSSEKKST